MRKPAVPVIALLLGGNATCPRDDPRIDEELGD
jgi:hypothetical protein